MLHQHPLSRHMQHLPQHLPRYPPNVAKYHFIPCKWGSSGIFTVDHSWHCRHDRGMTKVRPSRPSLRLASPEKCDQKQQHPSWPPPVWPSVYPVWHRQHRLATATRQKIRNMNISSSSHLLFILTLLGSKSKYISSPDNVYLSKCTNIPNTCTGNPDKSPIFSHQQVKYWLSRTSANLHIYGTWRNKSLSGGLTLWI